MSNKEHQFQKGYDPRRNPNGRPKGSKSINDALRRYIDADEATIKISVHGETRTIDLKADGSMADGIAAAMIEAALGGDLRAQQLVAERLEGRPKQSIDHTVEKTGIQVFMDPDAINEQTN